MNWTKAGPGGVEAVAPGVWGCMRGVSGLRGVMGVGAVTPGQTCGMCGSCDQCGFTCCHEACLVVHMKKLHGVALLVDDST